MDIFQVAVNYAERFKGRYQAGWMSESNEYKGTRMEDRGFFFFRFSPFLRLTIFFWLRTQKSMVCAFLSYRRFWALPLYLAFYFFSLLLVTSNSCPQSPRLAHLPVGFTPTPQPLPLPLLIPLPPRPNTLPRTARAQMKATRTQLGLRHLLSIAHAFIPSHPQPFFLCFCCACLQVGCFSEHPFRGLLC